MYKTIVMGKIKITKERIKELYLKGLSTTEIANVAGCTHKNISSHLKKMNINIRKPHQIRKYTLNEHYFSKIETEEQAYILGFLYADGYNQISKYQIRLTLQKSDYKILEKINKCINHNKPLIYLKNNTVVDLSINSKIMSIDLDKLGCMQNKTKKIKFPYSILPKKLYRHFIRGYFDGDGCISINKIKNDYINCQINITGNYDFIYELQKIFNSELNLTMTKLQERKSGSFTVFYHGKNICYKLSDYMYRNNNISLERKEKLYKKICVLVK